MFRIGKFLIIIALVPALVSAQSKNLSGFSPESSSLQINWEEKFDQRLSTANIDKLIKEMSARPHHIGSAGSKAVAEYIQKYFSDLGYDSKIETLYTLFATPKERLLEMQEPTKYKAILSEPALKEDATSGQKDQLPPYHCWSADGDVTGELVFVNFGLPDDYERLRQMGIDVKGKIVIAKYGRSWRGIKPKVAQENGAIGCIIYSDPMEDGYYQGDVYPKGAFKNEYGVQRGSVMDMPVYPGDPLTPGYGTNTADAKRLDRSEATNLLKIPVIPIGYKDAEPLLRALEGPVAPTDWRGALPITYHIGPGKAKVHLKLSFNWEIKPLYNVIATLKGTELPDEWVIRGNHHDAWVNGANDPISGMAALMEEARVVADLVKQGWKPKRTIIYCGWDGEEPGLLGSTEWAEFHEKELQENAVIYINSDANGRGFFGAAGSHALEPFINEIARDVIDPQTKVSILDRSRARSLVNASGTSAKKNILGRKTITLGALGSGSDYSPFFQHLGITSLNLGFGGENDGGEYHSIYDSYDHYKRFKDPKFEYGVALAKAAGRVTMRMSQAALLPFDFRSLQKTINGYSTDLTALLDQMRESTLVENQMISDKYYTLASDPTETYFPPKPKKEVPFLNFSELQNALTRLEKSTQALNELLSKPTLNDEARSKINKQLYRAEQQLLTKEGLPRRGWYRHTIYAPGFYTGYGVKTLPGIREAIEQRDWKEAQEQIGIAAAVLNNFATYLEGIPPGPLKGEK